MEVPKAKELIREQLSGGVGVGSGSRSKTKEEVVKSKFKMGDIKPNAAGKGASKTTIKKHVFTPKFRKRKTSSG